MSSADELALAGRGRRLHRDAGFHAGRDEPGGRYDRERYAANQKRYARIRHSDDQRTWQDPD
eukprot:3844431-Alexandrium_andersonii.AAC.1